MESIYQINEVKLSYSLKQKASERPKITHSDNVYKLLLSCFDKDTIELRESFKVLLLNRGNRVLGVFNVSDGGVKKDKISITTN